MRRNRLLFAGACSALLVASSGYAQTDDAMAEGSAPEESGEASSASAVELPAAAVAAPAAAEAPATGPADASYDLQMYELEDQLNELKESVFASKARLRMLWHQLMQDRIGGSRVRLAQVNEVGGLLSVRRVVYNLDGNQVFMGSVADDPRVGGEAELEFYDAPVLPGPHTVSVQVELQGNAHGIFSYMKGYEFVLTSSHSFTLEEGRTADIEIVIVDRGGARAALEDRPAVRYEVEITDSEPESTPTVEGGEG